MSKTMYEISLSVSFATGDITEEIDLEDLGFSEDEWKNLSEGEREDILNKYITEWSYNYIETGYNKL